MLSGVSPWDFPAAAAAPRRIQLIDKGSHLGTHFHGFTFAVYPKPPRVANTMGTSEGYNRLNKGPRNESGAHRGFCPDL